MRFGQRGHSGRGSSRIIPWTRLVVLRLCSQDQCSQFDGLLLRHPVISQQILRHFLYFYVYFQKWPNLEVVEDEVGVCILPGDDAHPQFSHKEDLITDGDDGILLELYCMYPILWKSHLIGMVILDPIGQLSDEVEEELRLRDSQH